VTRKFDDLDEEIGEGARSPVAGVTSALQAGANLGRKAGPKSNGPKSDGLTLDGASTPRTNRSELPIYLVLQASWFAAFGLQMVLFPYIIANILGENGARLGLAQMSLSIPSILFILLGGVIAERTDGRVMLGILHAMAAIPAAMLAWWIVDGQVAFVIMILYGLAMGSIGAFMMPARDAILNEVVARRAEGGSSITLQQGVAYATLVQFGGQILGLTLAGFASQWGVVSLLIVQAGIVAIGAGAAIFLKKGQSIQTGRVGIGAAFGDIWDGVTTVTRSPVLLPMTLSMVAVGVFIIGSFLVVLPLINRDVYGMGSDGIRNMFVTFWAGAFVSSVALTRMRRASRPGRMLLLAQFLGSICILLLVLRLPYPAFLSLVFVWGLAAGVSITMSRAIVQEVAPMDRLARVLSVYQLGFMGGAPLGAALMGILSDVFGPLQVAFVPAFGMAIMVIWIALATPIWTLQMAQPDAPSPVTPKPD